jgi:uncharacterized coiled-coil DUF342 family protein
MADAAKPETEAPAVTPAADGELKMPARMNKPDRNTVKDAEEKVKAEIAAIEEKIKAALGKAKQLKDATAGSGDKNSADRTRVKELKAKRDALLTQRTAAYAARDAVRETRDAKMSEMKDLKSQVPSKYKDVKSIDKAIKDLEVQQSTTSMTLAMEKSVLKEIEELKKTRKALAQHQAVASELDGGKAAAAEGGASIKDINEELSAIKLEMDKLMAKLNPPGEKKDAAYPALMAEVDALKASKKGKQDEAQGLWDAFKNANDAWRANQDEWNQYKVLKQKQDDDWYASQKAEKAAARAAELATKVPYEEEMQLCDFLANYLTTTFVAVEVKEEKVAPVVLAEFDGLSLAPSKKRDGDSFIALGKKAPKTGKPAAEGEKAKKVIAGTKRGKIILHADTLEAFAAKVEKRTPSFGGS